MTLNEITKKLYDLLQKDWSNYGLAEQHNMEQQLNNFINLFLTEIDKESSRKELNSILEFEKNHFFLPIPCLFKLYQRQLTLTKTNISIYKEFVDYLRLYGPDWEEEANKIDKLINCGKLTEAYKYALEVNYNKDFN